MEVYARGGRGCDGRERTTRSSRRRRRDAATPSPAHAYLDYYFEAAFKHSACRKITAGMVLFTRRNDSSWVMAMARRRETEVNANATQWMRVVVPVVVVMVEVIHIRSDSDSPTSIDPCTSAR